MAANSGRKAAPNNLRILKGRGEGKDGKPRDTAGRPLPQVPSFTRALPQKPFDLEGDASMAWDLIVRELGRVEILKPLDALALEMACEAYARWKDAAKKRRLHGSLGKNSQGVVRAPWVAIEAEAAKEFRAWCAEFGLTPAAEAKVGSTDGGTAEGPNPFIWQPQQEAE